MAELGQSNGSAALTDARDVRAKYRVLLDPEIWTFIDRVDSFYPPETITFPIERQRAVYAQLCRAFYAGRPRSVQVTDSMVERSGCKVPIRHYRDAHRRSDATILYYHGGGFVLGNLESHDDICAEFCAATGYDVLSADYRLAPEHAHPAAFDDALAVFDWVADTAETRIVLCGESAGGNLAAAVAHARREHAALAGQLLIYPTLGADMEGGSYAEHAHAPMASLEDVRFYRGIRTGGRIVGNDPTLEPLSDNDFSGLPPTVVVTAACDPLSSDGGIYRARLRAAGGKARWHEEAGLVHGYLRARHSATKARASFARIIAALAMLGRGDWHD
jgi:acetyl esterase